MIKFRTPVMSVAFQVSGHADVSMRRTIEESLHMVLIAYTAAVTSGRLQEFMAAIGEFCKWSIVEEAKNITASETHACPKCGKALIPGIACMTCVP